MEVKFESCWKEVVRYDCAHGFAHRDSYNKSGKHFKEELYLNFDEALNLADEDLNENWEVYEQRFLTGENP